MLEGFWNARPSALINVEQYRQASILQLHRAYQIDSEICQQQQQQQQPCTHNNNSNNINKLLVSKKEGCHKLRTCQWNINSLNHAMCNVAGGKKGNNAARQVANELIQVDSDVIVLNEFGSYRYNRDIHGLKDYLENAGYTTHKAYGSFPTAIATRLLTSHMTRFKLSESRNAIGMNLKCDDGTDVRIYGTHLDDDDFGGGIYRRTEAQNLLRNIQSETSSFSCSYTLIAGDLNQQRERDYFPEEWSAICANKAESKSPKDDGVSSLLEDAGFFCAWDQAPRGGGQAKVNWHARDPPPSTHWTGTIVDYTYARGTDLGVKTLYVSPSTFSDHRLIVTDWHWPVRKAKNSG